uniref:Uncharacterized protein n=1 Tax=Brassica oleracea TaxID=3712 RepID=A0A3P6A9Q9_BRAOL|nr:unnamed protein product [Brassica oleracea]
MAYHQKFAAYIGADFFRCGALYTHGTHEKMLSTYQKIVSLKNSSGIIVFFFIIHGFPASRIIPLDPVRQRSTSPEKALHGLDRTQYRFGVQKNQGSL